MEFGEKISKHFVDALETAHDARALLNLHNNGAGRLVSFTLKNISFGIGVCVAELCLQAVFS